MIHSRSYSYTSSYLLFIHTYCMHTTLARVCIVLVLYERVDSSIYRTQTFFDGTSITFRIYESYRRTWCPGAGLWQNNFSRPSVSVYF